MVQGAPCLAVAFLFKTGRTWVGQPTSLHAPFTQHWEGRMSDDGNEEMMGRLVQWQRHERFLCEEVQHVRVWWAVSMSRPCSHMLDSFTLICCTQFHGYSVLAPYSSVRGAYATALEMAAAVSQACPQVQPPHDHTPSFLCHEN